MTTDLTLYAYWIISETDYGDILPEDIPTGGIIPTGLWIAGAADQIYTGTTIKPDIRVYDSKVLLKEKKDYTIAYKNNTKVGEAVITVIGKGNYSGKETAAFQIIPVDLSNSNSEVYALDFYVKTSNKVQKPVPTLYYMGKKLKNKTDFTIEYANTSGIYSKTGEYNVVITGKGNYIGKKQIPLIAVEKIGKGITTNISKANVNNFEKVMCYTGGQIIQKCTLRIKSSDGSEKELVEGRDYKVKY